MSSQDAMCHLSISDRCGVLVLTAVGIVVYYSNDDAEVGNGQDDDWCHGWLSCPLHVPGSYSPLCNR